MAQPDTTTDFDAIMRQGGALATGQATRFFMRDDPVHTTLKRVTQALERLNISYAVSGGMALVAHGYDRTTADVDILLTAEGLNQVHESLSGLGYLPPFTGSRNLKDVETGVRIEFLVAGGFPGDGKAKPVAFPRPEDAAVEIGGVRYLSLEALIELKIASGMTARGRLKDLADVQELIRVLALERGFGERLNAYVREKYLELWEDVQGPV